jgi:hypothetical protein
MTLPLFILWLVTGGIAVYTQLRWAWANYPASRNWFILRFGSSFLCGAMLGVFLFHQDYHGFHLMMAIMLSGLGGGILFTFGSRRDLQRVIPKRDT